MSALARVRYLMRLYRWQLAMPQIGWMKNHGVDAESRAIALNRWLDSQPTRENL